MMPSDAAPEPAGDKRTRDKMLVWAALGVLTLLAWAATAHHAHMMTHAGHGHGHGAAHTRAAGAPWSLADFAFIFAMWAVMMTAMMLPSTAPMVTAYATINRRRRARADPAVPTVVFIAGYLIAWAIYAAGATAIHWALNRRGVVDDMMTTQAPWLASGLFIVAGLYQWTALKDACLTRCHRPETFILTEWREGLGGAIVMGLRHGLFCIGCCLALMLLMFAFSLMDLRWMVALTVLVSAEKLLPWPRFMRHAIGVGLLAIGLWLAGRQVMG